MSYPKGKTKVTCYTYEPWHYRYVGRTLAKQVHDSKLTLREFLWQRQNPPTAPEPTPTPSRPPSRPPPRNRRRATPPPDVRSATRGSVPRPVGRQTAAGDRWILIRRPKCP